MIENRISRHIILLGAIILALAVILGAFGAHSLKSHLTDYQMGIFQTGNRYHFYHGLGILLLSGLTTIISSKQLRTIAYLLAIGVILFSGSLYLLAIREMFDISHWTFLGPLTPIGGVFFVIGWLYLALIAIRSNRN